MSFLQPGITKPLDGVDGNDGTNGLPGVDGSDGVDGKREKDGTLDLGNRNANTNTPLVQDGGFFNGVLVEDGSWFTCDVGGGTVIDGQGDSQGLERWTKTSGRRLQEKINTFEPLPRVLSKGNNTGGNDIFMNAGDNIIFESVANEGALSRNILTAARQWFLPNKSGTIALEEDVQAVANLVVDDITARDALAPTYDIIVTVKDATLDTALLGGQATYQRDMDNSIWLLIAAPATIIDVTNQQFRNLADTGRLRKTTYRIIDHQNVYTQAETGTIIVAPGTDTPLVDCFAGFYPGGSGGAQRCINEADQQETVYYEPLTEHISSQNETVYSPNIINGVYTNDGDGTLDSYSGNSFTFTMPTAVELDYLGCYIAVNDHLTGRYRDSNERTYGTGNENRSINTLVELGFMTFTDNGGNQYTIEILANSGDGSNTPATAIDVSTGDRLVQIQLGYFDQRSFGTIINRENRARNVFIYGADLKNTTVHRRETTMIDEAGNSDTGFFGRTAVATQFCGHGIVHTQPGFSYVNTPTGNETDFQVFAGWFNVTNTTIYNSSRNGDNTCFMGIVNNLYVGPTHRMNNVTFGDNVDGFNLPFVEECIFPSGAMEVSGNGRLQNVYAVLGTVNPGDNGRTIDGAVVFGFLKNPFQDNYIGLGAYNNFTLLRNQFGFGSGNPVPLNFHIEGDYSDVRVHYRTLHAIRITTQSKIESSVIEFLGHAYNAHLNFRSGATNFLYSCVTDRANFDLHTCFDTTFQAKKENVDFSGRLETSAIGGERVRVDCDQHLLNKTNATNLTDIIIDTKNNTGALGYIDITGTTLGNFVSVIA